MLRLKKMADKLLPQVLVLSNVLKLSYHLKKTLPKIEFIDINPKSVGEYQDVLQNAEIIISDYDLITPYINNLKKTKWIQGTWAGVDYLIRNLTNKNFSFPITRFSGESYFGATMAEYTIAQIVSFERDFYKIFTNQIESNWNRDGKIFTHRLISDLTIGILGCGNIGLKIANTLYLLNAKILAFKKDVSGIPPNFISKYYSKNNLSDMLSECDYLINILPSTKETNNLLDGDVLKSCSEKQTIFMNIGRGNIISEQRLIKALEEKWIGGAILDVFQIEPLPQTSRLWNYPGVIITPHVSGVSRPNQIAELFKENYNLYLKNLPLKNIVDFGKEY